MTAKSAKSARDEVPVVAVDAPPGAAVAPAEDSVAAKLQKTRRVHGLTYDPANPPPSDDLAVVAQARVRVGEKDAEVEYPPGTRLTLPKADAEKLIAAGKATRG
jgi:hypothetical protein